MAITKIEMKQMLKQLEDKLINSFTKKIAKFKQEIQEELKDTKQALSTTYDLALKNENEINGLKDEVKALKELVTAQQTVTNKKAKSIEELKKSSSEQHEVLEDQVNRSLRKTLVFKGLAGTSDEKWDDTRQKLNSFIEAKIPTLQNVHPVERAHYAVNKANKDPNDKTSNVIFACFYNWNDAQLILKEFRGKPTEVRAEKMYSPSLTKRRNAAMLKRKELKESGKIVAGYVAFPANLKVKTEKDVYMWSRVALGMLGKLCITVSFNSLYIWSVELYPTIIRSQGMGLQIVVSRIGAASAPWIAQFLGHFNKILPFIVMGTLPLVSAFMLCVLKETKGQATAETLDDVKEEVESVEEIQMKGLPNEGLDHKF